MTGLGIVRASTGYKRQDEDVAAIAADYASQNNALMQRAQTTGLQAANRRGMLNGSIAAGASQAAVLDKVIPMASQTAGQGAQANLSHQGFEQESALSHQGFGQQGELQGRQFGHETAMQGRGFQHERGMQKSQFGYDAQLNTQAFNQQRALNYQQFGFTSQLAEKAFNYDRALAKIDNDAQLRLAQEGWDVQKQLQNDEQQFQTMLSKMSLSADQKQRVAGSVAAVWDNFTSTQGAILSNPNLSAAERAAQIKAAWVQAEKAIRTVEVTYAVALPNGLFK